MARRARPWYRADRGVWCVTIDGKRHNLGPEKKAAFDAFHKLMLQPRRRQAVMDSVASVMDPFLDWVQRNRSAATYEWYRCRLQSFVDHYPALTIAQLKPHHVERWAGDGKRSVTTRRNSMRSVKRCLKWAVSQGYLSESPIAHLEIPGGQSREVYIPPAEFQQLLGFVTDPRFAELLSVTYECGCRPQESLRVESRHVDLERRRWIFPASESKTKSMPRVVYLPESATEITRRLVAEYPKGPLFRNAAGRAWTKDAIGCAFDRLQVRMGKAQMKAREVKVDEKDVAAFAKTLKKERFHGGQRVKKSQADLMCEARCKLTQRMARDFAPRYSLYALRHSWATNALKNGVDALTVAILMGHRDPSTLARTYQHLSHNPEHLLSQALRACV
ncbi:MAG TPA: site-specific integrase [Lacipirellula sp.]